MGWTWIIAQDENRCPEFKKENERNMCCSASQLCPTVCSPVDRGTPGFPVLHCLPEFVQTHVHCVGDAIQLSVTHFSPCPQSFPASGSFPMSGLFTWGGQSIGASASASVLPMNIQGWFPLGLIGWSLCCPKGSKVSSRVPQFESIIVGGFFAVWATREAERNTGYKNKQQTQSRWKRHTVNEKKLSK